MWPLRMPSASLPASSCGGAAKQAGASAPQAVVHTVYNKMLCARTHKSPRYFVQTRHPPTSISAHTAALFCGSPVTASKVSPTRSRTCTMAVPACQQLAGGGAPRGHIQTRDRRQLRCAPRRASARPPAALCCPSTCQTAARGAPAPQPPSSAWPLRPPLPAAAKSMEQQSRRRMGQPWLTRNRCL